MQENDPIITDCAQQQDAVSAFALTDSTTSFFWGSEHAEEEKQLNYCSIAQTYGII